MNVECINHIGIAVKNLDQAILVYEKIFGLKCSHVETIIDQKVRTAFFEIGQVKIELLEPTGKESPIAKFIENKGEGVHHIAFAVNEIDDKLKELQANNIKLVDQVPKKGAHGLNVAFIHPKSTLGVLYELCEKPKT